MINSQKFNEQNPMFYAYVEMLGALVKEGVLKTSSDSKSTLLLYKTNLPTTFTQGTPLEGKTEGWVAENIFSVAQSLFNNKDERAEFYKTIKEKGIIPTFNENGTFKCLTKRAVPNDTHFGIHVGDYVYEPWFTRGSMIIHKVKSFTDSSEKNSPTKVNLELVVGDDDERCRKFFLKDEIGETIFLLKEEAKIKLKEHIETEVELHGRFKKKGVTNPYLSSYCPNIPYNR